jgi:hypothetical protein
MFRKNFHLWDNGRVHILVSLDADDPALRDYYAALAQPFTDNNRSVLVDAFPGGKVKAINHGLAERRWDICILAQDDVVPCQDYDQIVRRLFAESPWGLDAVVQSPDGLRLDNLITMPIVGRAWFDRFGYLYHPDYVALWCDNEMTDEAERIGHIIRHPVPIMRHHWIGERGGDALLLANEREYHADAATYKRRRLVGR